MTYIFRFIMPYPSRERKAPVMFQSYEDGDKHAPVSIRVEQARKREKERKRKSVPKKDTEMEKEAIKEPTAKKKKTSKKVDKVVVKMKIRKDKEKNAKKENITDDK